MKSILLGGGLSLVFLLILASASFASDETQFIRMPMSTSGATGLLMTQSIDTLSPGDFEVGGGGQLANYGDPDFSETMLSLNAALGVLTNLELAAQIPYIANTNMTGEDKNDLGDVRLSAKWRFMDASPELNLPGFGLSFSFFLPTGDVKAGTGLVDAWGFQALILSSAELELSVGGKSILVGVYGNGGLYWQDSGKSTEETHGLIDLGLLIPLEETRQWQMLLEASARVDESRFGRASDYTALMPGLRYITHRMALSVGWQYRFNTDADKDTDAAMVQASYLF